jgi:hypothetical protein
MQAKLLAAVLVLAACPVFAQSNDTARYQLISVSGGFVRLDMVTGVMTFCRDEVDSFRCAPIPADAARDETQPEAGANPKADRDEAKRDRGRDDMMKEERGFREDKSTEDFDRALSMMEKAMRSFMAMTRENPRNCDL